MEIWSRSFYQTTVKGLTTGMHILSLEGLGGLVLLAF